MYQDEIFENALKETKDAGLKELKSEVKTVERVIERFLTQLLESTSSISERDFNVCSL